MKWTLAATSLVLSFLIASPGFAQSEDSQGSSAPVEQSAPIPLNVEPTGIAVQDWEAGVAAIKAVPSPIGTALPGGVHVDVGVRGAEATLFLDGTFRTFAYDCPAGRCTGFAPDLWQALSSGERHAYVDGVLDALIQAYPGLGIYRVVFDGLGRASWDQAHGRAYFFNPPV